MLPRPGSHSPQRKFRWQGFADAGRGVWFLLRTQPNARVHLAATCVALGLAGWLGLTRGEWALLCGCITLVWVSEALNTAIEFTVDLACPERHQHVG